MNPTQMIALFCAGNGLPAPVPEWKFHAVRRWKFDLAWPALMVAFEIEGGAFTNGRHTRGRGFEGDCEKYSVAAAMGWKVIRATPGQIQRGEAFAWLRAALGEKTERDTPSSGGDEVVLMIDVMVECDRCGAEESFDLHELSNSCLEQAIKSSGWEQRFDLAGPKLICSNCLKLVEDVE